MEEFTSREIVEMEKVAITTLESLREKPAYERHNQFALYLRGEFEDGRLTGNQVDEMAELLGIPLARKTRVQVDVRFTIELDLPYSVAKEDELAGMEFSAYTIHPSKTLTTEVTDVSNIKL